MEQTDRQTDCTNNLKNKDVFASENDPHLAHLSNEFPKVHCKILGTGIMVYFLWRPMMIQSENVFSQYLGIYPDMFSRGRMTSKIWTTSGFSVFMQLPSDSDQISYPGRKGFSRVLATL